MTDIKFPRDFYLDDVGVWRLKKEKIAEMENPGPVTNEEWLRSCSTEQLAELIALICGSNILLVWRIVYHCADSNVDAVKMWLKQPHKENE